MPSDFSFKLMNAVHRTAQKVSFGRLGWTARRMPVVELTTVGRKTGQPRTVLLTSPVQIGNGYVVVASRGGDDKPPSWLGNIVANPQVEVSVRGKPRQKWQGRVASPEERAQWWPQVVGKYSGYRDYQESTSREIALVLLEPSA
jgi:deazaflavin-dependent oxidoreductase (nitroreductase family)